jgi:GxxExxY protein
MNADEHGYDSALLFGEETYKIIGCALEVLNTIGHGFLEKPYENSLAVELGLRNIPFRQQPRYEIVYKNIKVGEYVPDLVVFDKIIVDLKSISQITNHEKGQMFNYLKVTRLKVGLILNFSKPKLEWQRVIL